MESLVNQPWFWPLVVLLELGAWLLLKPSRKYFSSNKAMARWEKTRQRMSENAFAWLNGAFAFGGICDILLSALLIARVLRQAPLDPFMIPIYLLLFPAGGYFIAKWSYREMEATYQAYLMRHATNQSDSTELPQV